MVGRSRVLQECQVATRCGVQQRLGVAVLRIGIDCTGAAFLNHDAVLHDHDPVADLSRDPQVVRDKQHRQIKALANIVEQIEHLGLDRDVECRDRLVRDQHLWLHSQSPGDADALALSARELVRESVKRLERQANYAHQISRPVKRLCLADTKIHRPFDNRLTNGAARIQRAVGILKDDLDVAPVRSKCGLGERGDVVAGDQHFATGRINQSDDAPRDGRFSGTRFAHHSQGLAAIDNQIDVLRGMHDLP